MNSIYDLVKINIELGGFKLSDKLRELTSIMLVGQISVEEYDELTSLAAKYASGETEAGDTNILGALSTLNLELSDIKARLAALEAVNGEASEEEEYPAWERWNGLPDSGYKFGDKVTHLGVKYVSNYVGLNVWEPGLQGTESLWSVID